MSLQGSYRRLVPVSSAIANRPAIWCVLLGILLFAGMLFSLRGEVGETTREVAVATERGTLFHVDNMNDDETLYEESSDALIETSGSTSEVSITHRKESLAKSRSKEDIFASDPPGLEPAEPSNRTRLWQYEISLAVNASRREMHRRSPAIAFIKGLKVGGTSVAVALDSVARAYGIRPQYRVTEGMNRKLNIDDDESFVCVRTGSLWFHHGYKREWMKRCIPNVRFTTMLRDPISQTLSWEAMTISHKYYNKYPKTPCDVPQYAPIVSKRSPTTLKSLLKSVSRCVDTPFRKNITMMLVAHAVSQFRLPSARSRPGFPGMAVTLSADWILGENRSYAGITGASMIEFLKRNYFLVGVTEYMDEFLVLLALHMGWDPAALYYEHCKPTNTDIGRQEFARYFPHLMPKLLRSTASMMEAYEWAKREFEFYTSQLGPWFKEVVLRFKKGLKEFQKARKDNDQPYLWKMYRYKDGHIEDC